MGNDHGDWWLWWGGGGEVKDIINTWFYVYCSLLEDFCTKNIMLIHKNVQVNKP